MPATFPKVFGDMFTTGLASAGATAAVAGTAFGAKKIWEAATKASDFKSMLAFDPELAAIHRQNPKYTTAAFNTLRNSNVDLSKDPMVAAAFVRQVAITGDPGGAFGLASEALRTNKGLGPVGEAFHGGIAPGLQHALRESVSEEDRRNKQLDTLKAIKVRSKLENAGRINQLKYQFARNAAEKASDRAAYMEKERMNEEIRREKEMQEMLRRAEDMDHAERMAALGAQVRGRGRGRW